MIDYDCVSFVFRAFATPTVYILYTVYAHLQDIHLYTHSHTHTIYIYYAADVFLNKLFPPPVFYPSCIGSSWQYTLSHQHLPLQSPYIITDHHSQKIHFSRDPGRRAWSRGKSFWSSSASPCCWSVARSLGGSTARASCARTVPMSWGTPRNRWRWRSRICTNRGPKGHQLDGTRAGTRAIKEHHLATIIRVHRRISHRGTWLALLRDISGQMLLGCWCSKIA